jgi:hypothetical protein
MNEYARLADEAEQPPKRVVDHRAAWERLTPLLGLNGATRERVQAFAEWKRISLEALIALGTRVKVDRNGGVELAWAYRVRENGVVTALKFRPLGDKQRYALAPSVFLEPLVIGNARSLDWFVAEGETDGARLFDLVGDVAAVLVLPAGAEAFKRTWADLIPRGATVHLAHDADEAGDRGATKAARIIGGKTVRIRPPLEGGDWCDTSIDRDEFVALVAAARSEAATLQVLPASDFLRLDFPAAEVLLGSSETIIYLARGLFLLMYGDGGSGKSTLTLDAVAHLAAGRDWLGIPVARASRVLMIENEGAAQLFQAKLADKAEQWDADPAWLENVRVYADPWGSFTFANPHTREALQRICDEEGVDLVVANPLFGVGGPGSGRPDETSAFIDWLKELGLGLGGPAVWLLHHENKLGQVSGDWNRQPDTLISLVRDGDMPATKLKWEKTRWANRVPEGWRQKWLLEWIVEHKGYRVADVDLRGASDEELRGRIDAYLEQHPWASTNAILQAVDGSDGRLRELLKSGRYALKAGPRGSNLYAIGENHAAEVADFGGNLGAEVLSLPVNPHE